MKKWLRWTLGIPLVLSLLIGAFWWEENWRGRRMWEETSARLRAAGQPVVIADIIPPRLPDSDNVAAAPVFAEVFADKERARITKYVEAFSGYGGPHGMVRNAKGEQVPRPLPRALSRTDMSHLEEWREFVRACRPTDAPKEPMDAADEILYILKPWDEVLSEIKQALDRPTCRWPFDYEDGVSMQDPMLGISSAICMNERARVLAFAAKEDATHCAETLVTGLRFVGTSSANGPYLIGLLVANASDMILLQTLQHCIGVVPFGEPELAALQLHISQITLDRDARCLMQERVGGTHTMQHLDLQQLRLVYPHQRILPFDAPSSVEDAASNLLIAAIASRPEGWKLADGARYSDFLFNQVEPCIDVVTGTVLQSRITAMKHASVALQKNAGRFSLLRQTSSFDKLLLNAAKHRAAVCEALLWCAMERFRLKHGRIPEKLEELVPQFVDKVPCDPVNGLPLKYVRRGDSGYLLYSIGWNGKDDGGVETKNRETGDWVWASDPMLIINTDAERDKAAEAERKERDAKLQAKKKKARATSK